MCITGSSAQTPAPTQPPPTATPAATLTDTVAPTITPAMAVELRQTPAPSKSFWDEYGVIVALVSSIVGGILTLVFNKLLGPVVEDWGQQFREKLKGESRRFRERYIPALAEEHRHLKLVGIHGKEGVPQPLLKDVYVSLRMGGTNDGQEETRTLTIAEAFVECPHLLILGEPGAGKSTLLDWLVLVFTGQIDQPALRRIGNLLPVFLPLRSCVADDKPLRELMADPKLLLVDRVPPADFFSKELERGRCLVLLDGLDEVIDENQRKKAAGKINELVSTYPKNRYVITCRTAGWKEGLLTGDLAHLYIRDFDDAEIARFASGWYRAVRVRQVSLRGDLDPQDRQREIDKAEKRAAEEAGRLLRALKKNHSLYRLACNPLILSLIALVHYRRTKLPQGRTKLYQECLEILLEAWDNEDKELEAVGPSLHAKETILREVAYYYHSQRLTQAGRDELRALIAPLLPKLDCPTDADETLRQIDERSGILVSRAIDQYVFAHRTLQEYLVAKVLVGRGRAGKNEVLAHLSDEPWREVILLYSGLIGNVTALVDEILAQPDDDAHNTLTLAGECLVEDVEVSPYTRSEVVKRLETAFQAAVEPLIFERLGEILAALGGGDVIALFERVVESGKLPQQKAAIRALGRVGAQAEEPAAVASRLCNVLSTKGADVGLRQAAAMALAELGQADAQTVAALRQARQDAASAVHGAALWALLELGQAKEDMVKIPAGEFLMGSDKARDPQAREDELPQHAVYLPDYYILRTPVTNTEYAAFVEATGHAAPRDWRDGRLPKEKADHPVVNVTWHDAMAYCRWFGGVLPSEAEWEKAARGTDGRLYPWDDEWDKSKCNTEETGLGGTTPVGQYSPRGDSPYGCADMAGNVWQWTRSVYKAYPYDSGDGREDLKAGGSRVMRGGSFADYRDLARCASRNWLVPLSGWYYGGFRVVVSPISLTSAL